MSWTEERIATLKKSWEGGSTASQIAEELGGVSRNAVIGKAHRLGLKARPSPVKAAEKKGAPATASKPAAARDGAKPSPAKKSAPAVATPDPHAGTDARPVAWPEKRPDTRPETPPETRPETQSDARSAPLGSAPAAGTDDAAAATPSQPLPNKQASLAKVVSVGPGGFLRQGPGDQQPPIPPAPPRRLVPAKPSAAITEKTSLLDLSEKVCRWPMGHPGEPDFHFCGVAVNPGFPYCVEHCGRAYQAQLPRGARRPPPPLPFGGPRVR